MSISFIGFIGDTIQQFFISVMMTLDSAIYSLSSFMYEIFLSIASAEIFTDQMAQDIMRITNIIVGIGALFLVAYTLLTKIINPDKKDDNNGFKIVQRIVIAFLVTMLTPFAFDFLYLFQDSIVNNNVIPDLVLGRTNEDATPNEEYTAIKFNDMYVCADEYAEAVEGRQENFCKNGEDNGDCLPAYLYFDEAQEECLDKGGIYSNNDPEYVQSRKSQVVGNQLAVDVLTGFIYPNYDSAYAPVKDFYTKDQQEIGNVTEDDELSWDDAKRKMVVEGDFTALYPFALNVVEGEMNYSWLISAAAGIFLLYLLLTFSIDLAVRAAKLAFLQVIAPIPVFMSIIPANKDLLNNWAKKILSVYAEVFVRILCMVLAMYLIQNLLSIVTLEGLGLIAQVIMIMGMMIFAKQLPKFFSEVTGIKGEGLDLGIKKKLAEGGAFMAGSVIGGGLTSGVRNVATGLKDNKGKGLRGAFATARSGLAGTISGAIRGGKHGYKAEKFGDMFTAAGKGAKGATDARDRRDKIQARRRSNPGQNMFTDIRDDLLQWTQYNAGVEGLRKRQQATQDNLKSIEALGSNSDSIIDSFEVSTNDAFWKSHEFEVAGVTGKVKSEYAMSTVNDAISSLQKGYDSKNDYSQFSDYFDDAEYQKLFKNPDGTNKDITSQAQVSQLLSEIQKRQKALKKHASKETNQKLADGTAVSYFTSKGIALEGKTRGDISNHNNLLVSAVDDMIKNQSIMNSVITNLEAGDLAKVENSVTGKAYTAGELKIMLTSGTVADKAKAANIIAEYKKPYYDEQRRINRATSQAETREQQRQEEKNK